MQATLSISTLRKYLPDREPGDQKKFRDCQTFLESKSKWGEDIGRLPHLHSYGNFRPDPCRFCFITKLKIFRPGGGLQVKVEVENIQEMLKSVLSK